MRSIAPPPIDAELAYQDISRGRRPDAICSRLLAATPRVFAAYAAYPAAAPHDATALVPCSTNPATRQDLEGNYDSGSQAARRLKGAIFRANAGGRCCLCGQGRASTLDHYLPKSRYPEFSVLPMNLVPSCWDCNHKKGAAAVAPAVFLHSYFDAIPLQIPVLFAEVEVDSFEILISFRIQLSALTDARLATRIQSHFDALDLARYYMLEGLNEVSERRALVELILNGGGAPADVAESLGHEAQAIISAKGVNHWRAALLSALSQNQDFCCGSFLH